MTRQSGPTIASMQVRAVRVPMMQAHQTASGTVSESPLALTDIVTDSGMVGHNIVIACSAMALKPLAELKRTLTAPLPVS